jgi:microcystin-dependent protein
VDAYLGEIRLFSGPFAPRNWAFCDGQLMAINAYTALFAILGTTYGGDGRTNFALPDLRGALPVGAGSGPGLTTRDPGERGGANEVSLAVNALPPHTHAAAASGAVGSADAPIGNVWATPGGSRGERMYGTDAPSAMGAQALASTGGGFPHNNQQPYLAVSFIICIQGIFPARG